MELQKIGEKIDTSKLGVRNFNYKITLAQLKKDVRKFICWGARKFGVDNLDKYEESKWFSFYVSGINFKGYLYIELNGADLYNIYYTTTHGTIKDIHTDIYGDDICDVVDSKIEKIPEYRF